MIQETIDTVPANYHYKLSATCTCLFDEFMVNKYILIWCGIEISFVRMATFRIHVSADPH